MTRAELIAFVRAHPLAVVATTCDGQPEAALVGIAIDHDGELVFDTAPESRKALNLAGNSRVALVVGWDEERTLQIEGEARQPLGADRERALSAYFAAYPDGRERAASGGVIHFAVRPDWARFSDFSDGARIEDVDL